MKKFVIGILLGSIVTLSTTALADTGLEKIEGYLNKSISFKIDGNPVSLENTPITYNGTTYVPLRELGSKVGRSVAWDEQERTINIGSIDGIFGGTSELEGIVFISITEVNKRLQKKGLALKSLGQSKLALIKYNTSAHDPNDSMVLREDIYSDTNSDIRYSVYAEKIWIPYVLHSK